MKKCVILDADTVNPGDLSWDELSAITDLRVFNVYPSTSLDEVLECIGDAELVLLNKIPVNEAFLERLPKLEYIGVLATGYNVVDTAACKKRGVTVTNIPAYSTQSVAQMAVALLLELALHVGDHSNSVHHGDWANSKSFTYWKYPLFELANKRIGIYGFGRTGRATAQAMAGLGLEVVVADAHVKNKEVPYPIVSMDEFFSSCDVLSFHCPLTPETTGLVDAKAIEQMKDGVIIINTSRGPVLNEADVAAALKSGKIAACGVDVLSTEPPKHDNPMLSAPNTVITPHIAWAPIEARKRLIDITVNNVKAYLQGEAIHVVNP
ncbi:MAG: D-2-hydroxyacid dehydrogenase [Clostridiales bacterium]|nr:D-2-hydroxyacid dehydrogenase [Clostridiales bacterium]